MWRLMLVTLLVGVALAPTGMSQQGTKLNNTTEAGIDFDGNVYVASDEGKRLKVTTVAHCLEVSASPNNQTVGCSVPRGTKLPESMQSLRLEIYVRNGKQKIIETDTPIIDWHFWHDGQQVAVHSRSLDGMQRYALYDSDSARLIEELAGPSDESPLPEWAKTRAQTDDESVPMGDNYSKERTKWIAKVLDQIATIRPGMTRRDLLKVFTTEGGLATRLDQTYAYSECPYIKVNVRFKAANNERDSLQEEPNDIIESISQPYLAWSVAD
jgi:hypothetical protein